MVLEGGGFGPSKPAARTLSFPAWSISRSCTPPMPWKKRDSILLVSRLFAWDGGSGGFGKGYDPQMILVSVVHADPESGTIQPIAEISKITRQQTLFSTRMPSTRWTIPVDVKQLGVDLLTLSATEPSTGPKAAALDVRKGVRLQPLLDGGIQEKGLRAGTENVPGRWDGRCGGTRARGDVQRIAHLEKLQKKLAEGLSKRISHLLFLGHPTHRLPGNVSVAVDYIEGEAMLLFMDMEGIQILPAGRLVSPGP